MAVKKENKNQHKQQATIRIVIMAAILICVNILASYFHAGLDLTKEKRFTLSPATVKLLKNMQEVAVVDVYMKGKFPAYLQRLQEAVRERLRSFKDIAGNKIVFRFTDPFEGKKESDQKQIAHDLAQKGIRFYELKSKDEEEYSMKVFFPFALLQYNGREVPIMLLEDPPGKSPAEKINYAEAVLEYKFASAINQLQKPDITRIAYLTGNGEDLGINSVSMLATLPRYYSLDTVDLSHIAQISLAYDAVIINQPRTPFSGPEKLRIDQYVMRGGHILWNINQLNASLDSLAAHPPQIIAMDYGLDLDNLLFKFGVRVNNDLIEDMQCLQLPRTSDNGPTETRNWIYFPRINPTADHPIVKNMDFIAGRFTNSIDTIKTPGITKTILLQSSKYSRTAEAPVRVSLSMMNFPLKSEMFNKPYKPIAVLLEGKFRSAYQNLLAPEFLHFLADTLKQPFKSACDSSNSMIVTSVGDIFSNDYSAKDGVMPMGYYRWTGEFFANRDFLLNCLEYLTDRSGILAARSKVVKLRLLDTGRARDEKTRWEVINVAVPILIVLVFASCYFFIRKRRYEIKQTPKTLS